MKKKHQFLSLHGNQTNEALGIVKLLDKSDVLLRQAFKLLYYAH